MAKHLTKLFDSMAKLLMEEDGEGKVTNTAHTMVAKDGETVLFKVACIFFSLLFLSFLFSRWRASARARLRSG